MKRISYMFCVPFDLSKCEINVSGKMCIVLYKTNMTSFCVECFFYLMKIVTHVERMMIVTSKDRNSLLSKCGSTIGLIYLNR